MKKVPHGDRAAALRASSDAVEAYIAAVPEPNQTTLVRDRKSVV